jgi:hypothetical protein
VGRGYVYFIHGRIARRRGHYHEALLFFQRSIDEYSKRWGGIRSGPPLVRCLVNLAFVKRLLALRAQTEMDWRMADHRRRGPSNVKQKTEKEGSDEKAHISKLRKEAFEHLAKARDFCNKTADYIGLVNIHTTTGYLHLDSGEFDLADVDSHVAYEIAQQKGDHPLMARVRLLQSEIERGKFEELLGDERGPVRYSQLAEEFAREALDYAKGTQNERLCAQAYITLGLALCVSAGDNANEISHCIAKARALLNPEDRDYLSMELSTLKKKAALITVAEPILGEWSKGIVGNKTFTQINNEIATIIISKVWEHEGRRVSRTAARLSISPKKVRKFLQARGLVSPTESRTMVDQKARASL